VRLPKKGKVSTCPKPKAKPKVGQKPKAKAKSKVGQKLKAKAKSKVGQKPTAKAKSKPKQKVQGDSYKKAYSRTYRRELAKGTPIDEAWPEHVFSSPTFLMFFKCIPHHIIPPLCIIASKFQYQRFTISIIIVCDAYYF